MFFNELFYTKATQHWTLLDYNNGNVFYGTTFLKQLNIEKIT
ncbi:hypothetical protein MEC_00125 [Bartonella alsatica IBS 382]|uniref:Uncharacterized protein n=1 Tax=Bartonella alsatica IBS 382 TaxID=1094551 RepID=J0PU13_9HYPH|nr:hypothetical protein [Bartonella alsatica]EJF76016.1 hypothetical protein MEC_00125 [Bartonella alsatica IBS 382]